MSNEMVVLLHGMMRGRADMWPMQKYLEYKGYTVLNISYPARRRKLEDLAIILNHKIRNHKKYDSNARLNFVGHSLGAVLIRYYIRDFNPPHLGRVVMLGPPNAGSEWADYMLGKSWLRFMYRFGFGPVGEQLMTTHVHDDGERADYDLGIIAGNKNAVPFARHVMNGSHDGMVGIESTKLPFMNDHKIMEATHTYMITKPAVWRQIVSFLQSGTFKD